MQLAKDGKIILDLDEVVSANHTAAIPEQLGASYHVAPKEVNPYEEDKWSVRLIQFGSVEPTPVLIKKLSPLSQPMSQNAYLYLEDAEKIDDDEGLTLVTHKRSRRKARSQTHHQRMKRATKDSDRRKTRKIDVAE
ncbi:hypothetical protein vseg_007404 [Gypsophila vaccaria]